MLLLDLQSAREALTTVGALTIRKSQGKTELPLAMVPLLFGLQQITEGVVWISLRHDFPALKTVATYVYSMLSHVLWPILVPFAILLVETSRRRRRALSVFQALGLAVGLYLFYFLLRFPVRVGLVLLRRHLEPAHLHPFQRTDAGLPDRSCPLA